MESQELATLLMQPCDYVILHSTMLDWLIQLKENQRQFRQCDKRCTVSFTLCVRVKFDFVTLNKKALVQLSQHTVAAPIVKIDAPVSVIKNHVASHNEWQAKNILMIL